MRHRSVHGTPVQTGVCRIVSIKLKTYPVQALGGLLFVYMGPDPEAATLLPRWDVLARTDKGKQILVMPEHHCNWLQIQENTADSVHTFYLHGHRAAVLNGGTPDRISAYFYRPIKSYDWKTSHWGVEKMVEYGGEQAELEVRPPLIFPNILRIPEGPVESDSLPGSRSTMSGRASSGFSLYSRDPRWQETGPGRPGALYCMRSIRPE